MTKQEDQTHELSMADTKREMLAAYNKLLEELEEQREVAAKPEQKIEERKTKEVVEAADSLSTDGIAAQVGTLKSEIGAMLRQLSDKLEDEISKYGQVKQALAVKERELQEIYDIGKSASTLTALLEVQRQKREAFDAEIAEQREGLEGEIEFLREEWEKEKAAHDAETKERDVAEKKGREREAEEYKYRSERERKVALEEFEYQKASLEREIRAKQEDMEKDLAEREKALVQGEVELGALRKKVEAFPKELDTAVKRAVEEATERLNREAQNREELLKKEFTGEQNVLNSRIEALQQNAKEQSAQSASLSAQLEKSYGQVQDIALKAIEGSATVKTFVHSSPPQPVRDSSERSPQGTG